MISAIDETTVAARRPVLVDLVLQGGGSHVESRQAFGSLEKRSSAPPPLVCDRPFFGAVHCEK